MRNEVTILILQDRPSGLEKLQDELRRVQLFPLFSYISDSKELRHSQKRLDVDVIILVQRYFDIPFENVLHQVRNQGLQIPIIVILPDGQDLQGIELMKRGAQDFLLETELQRLPPSVFLAIRNRTHHPFPTNGSMNGQRIEHSPVSSDPIESTNPNMVEGSIIGQLIDVVTEVDVIGTIVYESPSITEQLGYTQDELIGRNAFSLIHPLDVPKVMPIFMVALATPEIPHSARFRFKHKNGTWRILEAVGKSIISKKGDRHVIVTSRVFTEEVRPRTNLVDTDDRFMRVVEALGEGILITDTSDKILYANMQMAEFTGHEVGKLLGQVSYKLFLPEEAWPLYMHQKEKWLLGNREEYEISLPRTNGEQLCMHVNVSPYRNNEGHIIGTLSAFIDITNRKRAEEEVQRAFEHLKVAKERAEEMNRLKTSFLNNIGHEVRTPLNSILGFSSLMSELMPGTDFATYAEAIHTSGKRLFDTFESILDLSRVESNTLALHPVRVSLDAEIYRISGQLEPQAREKGLEMSVEVRSPVHACVDPHYFERVIRNLMGNAIKFTSNGSVRIRLDQGHEPDFAEIQIVDTGIGISEDFLPHLFEEFYQESDGLARKFEGTGLGLRIAKRLLDAMGGSLLVKSTKGKGSCFIIRLPLNLQVPVEQA